MRFILPMDTNNLDVAVLELIIWWASGQESCIFPLDQWCATYGPWAACGLRGFLCSLPGPGGKEIWMNNMRSLVRVVSVARGKNYNVFAARGGKRLPTTVLDQHALYKVVKVRGECLYVDTVFIMIITWIYYMIRGPDISVLAKLLSKAELRMDSFCFW